MKKQIAKITALVLCLVAVLFGGTVTASAAQNQSLALKKTQVNIGINESAACISVNEKNFNAADCVYKTDNKKVATVNKKGVVTGKSKGTAVITVQKGKKVGKVTVKVRPAPSKVTLNESRLLLGAGETFDLDSAVTKGTCSYKRLYKSSNTSVAKVKGGGLVTAVAPGTATVTVETFNGKTAKCVITVREAPTEVFITDKNNVVQLGSSNHRVSFRVNGSAASKYRKYSTADKSVATVDSNGFVKGVKKGKTVLTVTTYNGLTASVEIKVQDKALSLNRDSAQIALDNENVTQIIYGKSSQNRNLEGYIITPKNGKFKKTLFINFAVHGFEDSYANDGKKLTQLANSLIKYYSSHSDELGKYRLVIVPCANPDGTLAGKNNKRACGTAFGRCTATHIDINRDFKKFKAVETRKLRDFIVDSNPQIYIDAHGWLNETLGTSKLCKIVDKSLNLGKIQGGVYVASRGYAIGWVHENLNIPTCLLEYKSPKSLNLNDNVKMIRAVIKEYN